MKVECWLVVKAKPQQYGQTHYPTGHPYAGQRKIGEVKATRIAQNKPSVGDDEVTFKVEFDVDEGWFLEGIAKIVAQIPAPPTNSGQDIQATVELPVKGRAKSAAAAVVHP